MTHPDIVQRLRAWRNANIFDYAKNEFRQYPLAIEAADEITTLRQQLAEAREALGKIMPIRIHDGPDYAEVYFGDPESSHSQAMTMSPRDWRDIQDLYEKLTPGGNHG